jgi:uncharacterized FlaG/YvyC family protein
MIGKIRELTLQKITTTVHGEMEQGKHHSSQQKSDHGEKQESEPQESNSDISSEDLIFWVKELNALESYIKNDLKFILSFEFQQQVICLQEKNGHSLHKYLPLQIKALYLQLKEDKADSHKGTILNLSC